MASGVGSLDSLDLLDLLFDRQDGILRGVELGMPPGTWHKDGSAQDGEDFLSSILGSGDSVSDSPSWSPAASDSGVSEDPPSDQLDSPPRCYDGGPSEVLYPYANPCRTLPLPGGAGVLHPEVSIDLDMWHPGFFLEESQDLPVVSPPASCTLTVKDLLLSGSSDAVSVPIPPPPQPCPFLDHDPLPIPVPTALPGHHPTLLPIPRSPPWSLGSGAGSSPIGGPAAAAGAQLPAEAEPGAVPGAGADGGREEAAGEGGGVPAHAAAPHQVRGAGAEENPAEDQEQAVGSGEPQEEEGVYRRAGEPDVGMHGPEPGAAEEGPSPGEAELVPPGAAEEAPGPRGTVKQQGSADGNLHRGPAALFRTHRLPLHQPLCLQQGRSRRRFQTRASFFQVPAQRGRLPRGLHTAPSRGREAPGAAVAGAPGQSPRDPARSLRWPHIHPPPGQSLPP
ncbi:cyclic AMP-responsive element-binding protein 3-like protein 3 isoform X3 [Strix aluco]